MNRELVDKLEAGKVLSREELIYIISEGENKDWEYLFERARAVRDKAYGRKVFMRGLIEISNICKNDCLYCGIRKSNPHAERYRLNKQQILDCCAAGYELGFRTFVMQGGEDPWYTDEIMIDIISSIKARYPDCAITLSLGEKSYETYKAYFDAGADRYLLRHETANEEHYKKLHPKEMSLRERKQCLYNLKEIGFQTGCGFMVGSPYQTAECIAEDLMFIRELDPQMVGIGPFIPQKDTPFGGEKPGTLEQTLRLLAIIRLMLPNVLLPATTALGTIHPEGRELGIMSGANVVMPNLSPLDVRKKYLLYDNKICTGDEAAECCRCLKNRMSKIGHELVVSRGDYKQK